MPLNNEIDIITVGGVDQDVKDTYTRRAIAGTEPLSVASRVYKPHEVFFSAADRLLYETLTDIAIGTTFTPDVNVKQKSVSDLMYQVFAQAPETVLRVASNYETTAVASKTYHNNDRIVWTDGVYYRVSGTVSQGTAWVVGGNIYPESNISDLIKNLEDNKDGKIVLTQRLVAGETTLTFTHQSINDNSLVEVYTDIYGKNPTAITQSGNTVMVTFRAQAESMTVKLVVREE